jgi:hypothetical protein
MGHSILGRMDDMGTRMDELEQSIAALLQHAGLDQNGFGNNTSFDTTTSFTSQNKTNPQRASATTSLSSNTGSARPSAQNKMPTQTGVAASPTPSIHTPASAVNNSPLVSSVSHIISPTPQSVTATPARARVTIEI